MIFDNHIYLASGIRGDEHSALPVNGDTDRSEAIVGTD
jgi:hypothetical protein